MQDTVTALAWTLIHSLWQGLAAALLAAIIISSTRKTAARWRYNLLGIVLLCFLSATVITFFVQWRSVSLELASNTLSFANAPLTTTSHPFMDNFTSWVNNNSSMLILVWASLFFLYGLKLITGLAAVNRLRNYQTASVPAGWTDRLNYLQNLIGVKGSVLLLQSALVKVPVALGILKPVILVPIGLINNLPAEQVETILLHELAHIRRRDYLVNLLQHIAEAIFFFNPAVRWISSLLRQEREACCDDMVVASGSQRSSYINALLNFQDYSLSPASYAMGIGSKRYYLLNRVKRLLTNTNKGINIMEKINLFAGIALFTIFSLAAAKKEVRKTGDRGYALVGSLRKTAQQTTVSTLQIVTKAPTAPVAKKAPKKITRQIEPVADTLPAKKDTIVRPVKKEKTVPPAKSARGSASDAKLKEIAVIKEEMGKKKASIGAKKEQLKGKDEVQQKEIKKEIDKERDELEKQRDVLDIKREEWDKIKKKIKEKEDSDRQEKKARQKESQHENDKNKNAKDKTGWQNSKGKDDDWLTSKVKPGWQIKSPVSPSSLPPAKQKDLPVRQL